MEGAPETGWHLLLRELIDEVLSRLSLEDFVGCGLVCKQWRTVMLARQSRFRPPPVLATLKMRNEPPPQSPPATNRNREYEVSLSCLIDNQLRRLSIKLPAVVLGELDGCYQPCLGNSGGWLHVQRYGYTGYLLNPTSGQTIALPYSTGRRSRDSVDRVALSSPPSSTGCTVAAFICKESSDDDAKIAFWTMAYGWWTIISRHEKPIHTPFSMAFHRGELYVVHQGGVTEVYRLDAPIRPKFLRYVPGWVIGNHPDQIVDVYLVGAGDLYLIVARDAYTKFEAYKLDAMGWVEVADLGGHAFFVDYYNTHCYRPCETMGTCLRPNCIYFLGQTAYLYVYSMEDRSIEQLLRVGGHFLLMPNEW